MTSISPTGIIMYRSVQSNLVILQENDLRINTAIPSIAEVLAATNLLSNMLRLITHWRLKPMLLQQYDVKIIAQFRKQ